MEKIKAKENKEINLRFSTKDKKWIERRQKGWREFRERAGIDEAEEEIIWSKVISSTKVRMPKKSPCKAIPETKLILRPSILSCRTYLEDNSANETNLFKSDKEREIKFENALTVNTSEIEVNTETKVKPQVRSQSESPNINKKKN